MCIAFLAFHHVPGLPIVLAANRDEFYNRAAKPMHFWEENGILAGKDLKAGGAWLGLNPTGRLAFITNFREPSPEKKEAPTRGRLIPRFLDDTMGINEFSRELEETGSQYNGFNLIYGNSEEMFHYSNRSHEITPLTPGIYGLSNHLLNTSWPKVERGINHMNNLKDWGTNEIFKILAHTNRARDNQLPQTGVSLEWERLLSPIFIHSPDYGTRSGTVVLMHEMGRITVEERTYQHHPDRYQSQCFQFLQSKDTGSSQ